MTNIIIALLTAASIPSLLASFFFWWLKRKITKIEAERDNKDKKREDLQLIILDGLNGTISLSEATAKAVQRIPDAQCNGDMHAALDSISKTKERQREFLTAEGIHNIL